MQTSVPTALILAPTVMPVNPKDVLIQAFVQFPDAAPISTAFQSLTSEAVPVSRRLGFEESSPQAMGTVSSIPFPLVGSPFVPLFSLLAVTHPIQPAFAASFSHFPFAVLPSAVFASQAIDHPDEFQQQVVYDRIASLSKTSKRKEKEGSRRTRPHLQTYFNEQRDCLYSTNLVPKVDKPESQMRPDDYALQAINVSLQSTTASDKVGMMEETYKVVSIDFIKKSHRLEKLQAENVSLRDSLTQ